MTDAAHGNPHSFFEGMSHRHEDAYMWALDGFIEEARACLSRLQAQPETTS